MATRAARHPLSPAEPSPGPAPAVAAARRARILEAAATRFAAFGFEATTVRQIAQDVSILSGSLYHYFATKEDMLHEILREPVLKMRDNVRRIAAAPVDAEHRLIATILLDLGELTRNLAAHAILTNDRQFFRRNDDFAYIVEAKAETYAAWKTVLSDGVDAGLFRPDLDIYLTITTIFHTLSSAADWYNHGAAPLATQAPPYSLDAVIDFHLSFILSAVRAPGRAAAPIPRKDCEALAAYQA